MIPILSTAFVSAFSKIFYAFFTEKIISNIILSILRMLAKKTTNTLDDEIVEQVAKNLKV
ncbi:MAG: hypothetical protein AB7E96_10255 [Deferribacterales bacterium]